ncbi:uracil-DNA glycosylase [Chlorobium phaeovibrioides]|uniref:Type-4 uracil-DNA glycosylase n=2 Tax=Chlorobium phaeovibrioides TaxID=1094 RepID=A0A432AVH0_CHLPH|nr:uracil-DNA glycosylase [Chlorobium phaeovibrioides]HCD35923.1 uracil-DNA glycosylase [Chlorobium sp.]KAA6230612.1 uracil-DNA glycosylase [Chlorobium phaeovibrioides]MWV55032.1 uracil-DNA glycosylase [Chlorobium phaeovibrioides]QEQ56452.1 uracil-DNA glycosylase [Chlorobium phaeovibrioides]RTY33733.1 uracil-DNA glycosylase [Chlorobium phaeovibrioides]
MNSSSLEALAKEADKCRKCRLADTRHSVVFGEGNPEAGLMVIGEAPGADEDASGRPFIGRSGQLLTKILQAVEFSRDEVFIANIVKCRPPENRNPLQDEIACCTPWLEKQLEIIRPKVILLLGKVAANTILVNQTALGTMRGKVLEWKGTDCFVTYHPAALLRNPNWKRGCREDVQLMRRHYDNLMKKSRA